MQLSKVTVGALVLASALALHAQKSSQESVPPDREKNGEEVVTLPDYTVQATADNDSYVASEAVSGTRIGAKIAELPYSVSVLTSEFLNDFQLFEPDQQLRFVSGAFPGAEDTGANTGKKLRGFTPPTLRDGFSRANPADRVTLDRVEFVKGPMSAIYGLSSPGGLINNVSKRPRTAPKYSANATFGNYGYERYGGEATGPISSRAHYYLIYGHNYNESDLDYFYVKKDVYAGALALKVGKSTSVTTSIERQHTKSNQGDTIPLLRVGSITTGLYWDLARFNIMGPDNVLTRDFDAINVLVEHKFSENLSGRINLQSYDKDFEEQQYRYGSGNSLVANGTLTGEAFKQNSDESKYLGQADILWRIRGEKIEQALLVAGDFTLGDYRDITFVAPPVRTSPTVNRRPTFVINPFNPVWVQTPGENISQTFQDTQRKIDYFGAFASYRAFLLERRLILMSSARYDKVENNRLLVISSTGTVSSNDQTPVTTISDGSGSGDDSWTYSLGGNFKLMGDRLVAFANRSTAFEPTVTIDGGTGGAVPNESSGGWEAGLKGLFLGDKLAFTTSIFKINKKNVAINNPNYDPAASVRVPQFIGEGEEQSKGVEVDARWDVTSSLFLQVGGAYVDGEVISPASARERQLRSPHWTGFAVARYSVREGVLKGLRFGVSSTYASNYLVNSGSATRFRQIHPSLTLYNAFISYRWKMAKRFSNSVSVNGLNLFDEYYVTDTQRLGRGREIRFSYNLGF